MRICGSRSISTHSISGIGRCGWIFKSCPEPFRRSSARTEHDSRTSRRRPLLESSYDQTYPQKFALLARLALTRPKETMDRLAHIVETKIDALMWQRAAAYRTTSLDQCLENVADILNRRLETFGTSGPM